MRKKKKEWELDGHFVLVPAILLLFIGILFFAAYFHNIDTVVNYQRMKHLLYIDTGKDYAFIEADVQGRMIGGLLAQHELANRMMWKTFLFLTVSFMLLVCYATMGRNRR